MFFESGVRADADGLIRASSPAAADLPRKAGQTTTNLSQRLGLRLARPGPGTLLFGTTRRAQEAWRYEPGGADGAAGGGWPI